MQQGKILVVDDDRNLLELARMRLESANYEVATALTEEQALDSMKGGEAFDLSIVDLQLAKQDGISLMQQLHGVNPEMPVIILTAYGTIESAVEAMKKGAYSYVTKPFEARELLFQIEKALENRRLNSEVRRVRGLLEERYGFENIAAKSEKMQKILELVARGAKTDSTIYVHGESGTGKELIAKAVHLSSARRDMPFVAINCAALPESLLQSELFGHEKGAFTGERHRQGADREGGALEQRAAGHAFRCDQLRRSAGVFAAERAIRAREGRVHGRAAPARS